MGDEEGQSHHLNGFYLQCALSDDSQELPAGSTKLRLSPQGRPHQACNVLGQCMRQKGNGLLRRLVRKSKKEEWNLVPRAPLLTALQGLFLFRQTSSLQKKVICFLNTVLFPSHAHLVPPGALTPATVLTKAWFSPNMLRSHLLSQERCGRPPAGPQWGNCLVKNKLTSQAWNSQYRKQKHN